MPYLHQCAVRSAQGSGDALWRRLTDPTPFADTPVSERPGASNVDFTALFERLRREAPDIWPRVRVTRGLLLAWDAAREVLGALDEATRTEVLSSLAIVLGNTTSGLNEALDQANEKASDDALREPLELGALSADLSLLLGAQGPELTISTACTASGKALAEAARLLRTGCVRYVLAGGFDVLNDFTDAGFRALGAESSTRCAPLAATRSGLHLGEGGALFLFSTSPVLAGRPALAALAGWGETSDAHHVSAPHPEGHGATEAMHKALEMANRRPEDVDVVLLHGTATVQNDKAEARALRALFPAMQPPSVSLKRAIGHTLAGAAALNAAVATMCLGNVRGLPLALRPGERLAVDPEILSLGIRPIDTNTTLTRPVSTVLLNAFAFGGNNLSLVLTRTKPPVDGWNPDELLVQKPPMRFITSVKDVVAEEGKTPAASGTFTVTADHIMTTRKGFPATGLLEVMAQTIGLYAGAVVRTLGDTPRIGLLLGCRRLSFTRPFYPVGSTFRSSVEEVFRSDDGLRQFAARVEWMTEGGPEPAAEALLTVYQPEGRLPFAPPST